MNNPDDINLVSTDGFKRNRKNMNYTIDIQSWSAEDNIPYSRELEDEISKTVVEWINKNVEHPGNWVTHISAQDKNGFPYNSGARIN